MFSCASSNDLCLKNSFVTVYNNSNGNFDKEGYVHVTNNEDYIKCIESLKIEDSSYADLAAVNFTINDVLILHQGPKKSSGFAVDVASIHWESDLLCIHKREKTPEKNEIVISAITNPYCISFIPKTKKIKIIP